MNHEHRQGDNFEKKKLKLEDNRGEEKKLI